MTAVKWVDPRAGFATPAPVYEIDLPAEPVKLVDQAPRLPFPELQRVRAAGYRAAKQYPGAVGELIHRELQAYEDFGQRLDRDCLLLRVVEQVMALPALSIVDKQG